MLDEADIWGEPPTRGTGTSWDYHLPLLQKTIPLSRRAELKREASSDCTLLSDTSDCCASATTTNMTTVLTIVPAPVTRRRGTHRDEHDRAVAG